MRRIVLVGAVATAAVAATAGCSDGRSPGPVEPGPEDVTPPVLSLVHAGDRTGDGLVDFEVAWADPGRTVRGTTVVVRSLRPLRGPNANASNNLLDVWTATADSNAVRFSESVFAVLPAGDNFVEVRVSDAAGNAAVDTFTIRLPQLELHKRIGLGRVSIANLLVCNDPHIVIPASGRMIVISPDDSYIREIANFWQPVETPGICADDQPVVFLAGGAQRFDIPRVRWGDRLGGPGESIAQSAADPDRFYLGGTGGRISILDVRTYRSGGELTVPGSNAADIVTSLALLPSPERLIAAVYERGLVLIRTDGTLVAEAEGVTNDLLLSKDRERVYAGMRESGFVQFDAATLTVRRTLALDGVPRRIAVRDDETRAFVTTDDIAGPSHNYLVDLINWRVIAQLPRPRADLRIDSGVAFEPSGTRLYTSYFTPQGSWLEIYLDRS